MSHIMNSILFKFYLKFEKETLKYFESPEGIKSGLDINEYYDTFIKDFHFNSGPKPDFNPWRNQIFKTGASPKDVYSCWGKIDRGFFISNRLKDFLQNFNIANHVIFEEINYFNGKEYKKDLNWIAFYDDNWKNLDYSLTEFYLYDRTKSSYKDDGSLNFIESKLKFNNFDNYTKKSETFLNSKYSLGCTDAYFNTDLDLFPLFKISGVFFVISEILEKEFKKAKFSGLDFLNYKFGLKVYKM